MHEFLLYFYIHTQKKYEPKKKHSYLKRSPKTTFVNTPPKSFVRKRDLKTPPVPRMSKQPVSGVGLVYGK